jgi:hypothetical protein
MRKIQKIEVDNNGPDATDVETKHTVLAKVLYRVVLCLASTVQYLRLLPLYYLPGTEFTVL